MSTGWLAGSAKYSRMQATARFVIDEVLAGDGHDHALVLDRDGLRGEAAVVAAKQPVAAHGMLDALCILVSQACNHQAIVEDREGPQGEVGGALNEVCGVLHEAIVVEVLPELGDALAVVRAIVGSVHPHRP